MVVAVPQVVQQQAVVPEPERAALVRPPSMAVVVQMVARVAAPVAWVEPSASLEEASLQAASAGQQTRRAAAMAVAAVVWALQTLGAERQQLGRRPSTAAPLQQRVAVAHWQPELVALAHHPSTEAPAQPPSPVDQLAASLQEALAAGQQLAGWLPHQTANTLRHQRHRHQAQGQIPLVWRAGYIRASGHQQ